MTKNNTVFFPGINGLRFMAALAVIITHIELLKGVFGYNNAWENPFIFYLGGLGVYFFFVLSGFLITYLLLEEKKKFDTIKIKEFYLRRILRIWPLYYFVLILGFFALPHFNAIQIPYLQKDFEEHFYTDLLLYFFIFPNLAFSMYRAVPHIGQAWSIGVEEQFYIAWPWLILKAKKTARSLFAIIGTILLIKIIVLLLGIFYGVEHWYQTLKTFVAMSKFECMAIGGLGAYYLHKENERVLKWIYRPLTLNASIILIPILMYVTPDKIQDGVHLIFSVIFLVIIINVAGNKKIKLDLNNGVLSYLGKISYGIYMYHFMIIPIVLYFLGMCYDNFSELLWNILLYSFSIGLTILVSGVSYRYFESKFIKLKARYSLIKSGGEGPEKIKEEKPPP
jgi:peptidoglycan/LPS O-acetylase OafA/YrhL